MDAVKFMQEYNRLCRLHGCVDCPINKIGCFDPAGNPREESEYSEIVEVVGNWSKEHPEEVGKKYIIEIDEINEGDGDFHYKYRIKGTEIWLTEQILAEIKKVQGK